MRVDVRKGEENGLVSDKPGLEVQLFCLRACVTWGSQSVSLFPAL